ncbi:hypothetical protein PO883_29640 [Massilia sp. DJPM01]|uniref:hypothetical protein n=1 Tax=Massilia sp. DJPM01 TaxID=3024404 RepID=UPI00259E4A5B|nr:hypothetical protein [Massilia sp. DJPM01]MDM5181347.1 hypothetical protein [Massilia sp. DJPM01]
MQKKNLLASVEIPSLEPLDTVARRLESAIDGTSFEMDESGRYEEVPAFVARHAGSGSTFILFGIPDGEECDAYTLEFSAATDLPIGDFQEIAPDFVKSFLCEKEANARGYLDYSDELAGALILKEISAARAD